MILGHDHAWRQLLSALARDQLHHALLFEGPPGVGKRTLANALARAANCTTAAPGEPACETCPSCRSIATGNHPDVIALEPSADRAARTIPIETVREVIRQAQYHRYSARRRFVIIDPAEAMQEPAANALLKTLEEPPRDTHFAVITHNARALLPTIVSRCQRVRLGAVPLDAIRGWLSTSGHAEVADAAARLSQGCPGRALELAEKGLQARTELRGALFAAVLGSLQDVYDFSAGVTNGARQDWAEAAQRVLELLEDAVRDAIVVATGAGVPCLDDPPHEVVDRLARTWPHGVRACQVAIQECRDDLEVYVTGKTALDALVAAVRAEIQVS